MNTEDLFRLINELQIFKRMEKAKRHGTENDTHIVHTITLIHDYIAQLTQERLEEIENENTD